MPSQRVSSAERRILILSAAQRVFAEKGYDGAKTQRIAAEANISEALVYRHFPSKLALYRAVLRSLVREKDAVFEIMHLPHPSTAGIVHATRNYLKTCITHTEGRIHESVRMMLASLAGEGGYASLVYRRSVRKTTAVIDAALDAAQAAGDLRGPRIKAANFTLLVEHVGSMLNAVKALPSQPGPYDESGTGLLTEALWFCCRGVGLSDEAIARHIDA